ncbi:DUF6279 family lipoprotein [Rhodoferax koreense]|uniref:DUF6279 family lipoprotein n=1 Tax=Rhodoferax koreensis TaxID=1842727 RepID=UPI0009F8A5C2|nr:DUF6279 family lipoprotein [Rhodoferax koreense]
MFATLGRIIGLLLAAAVLQSCSAIKLGYNNGPDLAYWWLDGYADFTGEQAIRLKEDLGQLQAWHRRRELPEYAKLLRQAQALMPQDVDAAQVCSEWANVRQRLDVLVVAAAPTAAQLAMTLQPQQITALEKKYARSNADFRKDWLDRSPEQVLDKRYDKALENAQTVYGRLDTEQRELLRQQVARSGLDEQTRYAERLRRQQDTLQTLRQWLARPPEPAQAVQEAREAIERLMRPSVPGQKAQEAATQQMCEGVAALHNRTTAAQRQHGLKWLAGYERDLKELAAQPQK